MRLNWIINFLENIGLSDEEIKEKEQMIKDGELFAKVCAVAIYADFKRKDSEKKQAAEAIKKFFKKADLQVKIFDEMLKLTDIYMEDKSKYLEDEDYVLNIIIKEERWDLAKVVNQIFIADGYISSEEDDIWNRINDIVERQEVLNKKIKDLQNYKKERNENKNN